MFKGFIGFIGAHYMSYIRHVNEKGTYWKVYNDVRIQTLAQWSEVVNEVVTH